MLEAWVPVVVFAAEFLLRIFLIVRVLVHGSRPASVRLAWILILLLLPVVGIVTYLLVGEVRLGGRHTRRHAAIVGRLRGALPAAWIRSVAADLRGRDRNAATLAETAGGMAARAGNGVELVADTDDVIERLVEDIAAARDHVHLLTYIYLDDSAGHRVGEALQRAAARRVATRVLVDGAGSRDFLRSALAARMRAAGVRLAAALPAHLLRIAFSRIDVRNHRKLAVVDGAIGWTGSQNIAAADFAPKPRYAPWVDAMLRLEGPAVHDLQQVFLADWHLDTDEWLGDLLADGPAPRPDGIPVQILPTGPDVDNEPVQQLAHAAFHTARSELILTTPYFLPPDGQVASLCSAARRGVEVHLVLPRRNDSRLVGLASRSLYATLLGAGVAIHEYGKGLLHAKTITIDRELAFVGSANFDRRSLEINFEVNALVYDSDFASRLRFLQRGYMQDSRRVDRAAWGARSSARVLVENAAGLFGPLL